MCSKTYQIARHEGVWGNGNLDPPILKVGNTRWWALYHGCIPPGETAPSAHWIGVWVGLTGGLEVLEKRKHFDQACNINEPSDSLLYNLSSSFKFLFRNFGLTRSFCRRLRIFSGRRKFVLVFDVMWKFDCPLRASEVVNSVSFHRYKHRGRQCLTHSRRNFTALFIQLFEINVSNVFLVENIGLKQRRTNPRWLNFLR
jgi:hypothetical protein